MAPKDPAATAAALAIFVKSIKDPGWRKRLGAAGTGESTDLLKDAGVVVDDIPEPVRSSLMNMSAEELDVVANLCEKLRTAGLETEIHGTILCYL